MDETTTVKTEPEKPFFEEYIPGPITVLIDWLILIFSTIMGFFQNRE